METSVKRRLALCFVGSGFSGLVCQVVWTRLAMAHFGVITPILSVVISAFMLGLALGSIAAGRWAARSQGLTPRRLLRAYAISEVMIGIGAVAVPVLFRWGETLLLTHGAGLNSEDFLARASLYIVAALFPWCFAMGATFPLMMGALRSVQAEEHDSFSFLYLANVIGAVFGTLLSAWVLIELFGFTGTLRIAALANAAVALFCLSLSASRAWAGKKKDFSLEHRAEHKTKISGAVPLAALILFLTGLTSMGLEVVWVRNFTAVLGTTIYAFAMIVALYLIATAGGSYVYRKDRAQGTLFPLSTLLAAALLGASLPILLADPRAHLGFIGIVLTIMPYCAVLGYLTPYLIDHASDGDPGRAGTLYALNIAGCVLGPLVASYLLLAHAGVKLSLVFFALPYLALFLAATGRSRRKKEKRAWLAAMACLLVAVAAGKSYEEQHSDGVIRRDYAATVISLGHAREEKRLLVNGIGITSLETMTKCMAHVPLGFCPRRPKSALAICFGMGTTYRSLLSWNIKVTAVELVPSVVKAFPYYFADAEALLNNPNGRVVVDDGRRFLQRTEESFDVVTIDPPPPFEAAGSSLLYSREFYELIKRRLNSDGILQQWLPAYTETEVSAVVRSMMDVFPYVRGFRGPITGITFIASAKPLSEKNSWDILARLPRAAKKDLVEWESVSAAVLLRDLFAREVAVPELLLPDRSLALTDDRPYNEYHFVRRIPVRFGLKHKGQT